MRRAKDLPEICEKSQTSAMLKSQEYAANQDKEGGIKKKKVGDHYLCEKSAPKSSTHNVIPQCIQITENTEF